MIADSIKHITPLSRDAALSGHMIDFAENRFKHTPRWTKTVIDGDHVVNVMEADLREAEGATLNITKKYADLQII